MKVVSAVNQETWRFLCAICHAPLSGPLIYLPDVSRLRLKIGDMHRNLNVVPPGFFANGSDAKSEMRTQTADPVLWSDSDLLFYPGDLRQADRIVPGDFGCCGLTGTHGPNLFCCNGHVLGTQITDCCTLNFARVCRANLVFDTPDDTA